MLSGVRPLVRRFVRSSPLACCNAPRSIVSHRGRRMQSGRAAKVAAQAPAVTRKPSREYPATALIRERSPGSALSGGPQKFRRQRSHKTAEGRPTVPLKVAARVRIPLGVQRRKPLVVGFSAVGHQEWPDADTAKIPRKLAGSGRIPAESPPKTRDSPYGRAATLPCRHLRKEAVQPNSRNRRPWPRLRAGAQLGGGGVALPSGQDL